MMLVMLSCELDVMLFEQCLRKSSKFGIEFLSTVRQFSYVCGLVSLEDQHCCLMLLLLCVVHTVEDSRVLLPVSGQLES